MTDVYRGREGWTQPPREENALLRRPLPLFLILISPILPPNSNESLDIHITLTGNEETPN